MLVVVVVRGSSGRWSLVVVLIVSGDVTGSMYHNVLRKKWSEPR